MRSYFLLKAVLVAWASLQCAIAAPLYSVVDLGDLSGGHDRSLANGINDSGWVTGISYSGVGRRAFLWTPQSNGIVDLGSLGGNAFESIGSGISNNGDVVGWSKFDNGSSIRGFVWTSGTGMHGLPGSLLSQAVGINNAGTAVGSSGGSAVHWSDSTSAPQSISGGSFARAINESGQIVGVSPAGAGQRVFLNSGGSTTTLATLPGIHNWSYAYDINNSASVVGASRSASGATHAVLWKDELLFDLGDFSGGLDDSRAMAINDSGWAVGYGVKAHPTSLGILTAAMWAPDGSLFDLNDFLQPGLGVRLGEATGINASGQIIAQGTNSAGQSHAFLLTPIPEPSVVSEPSIVTMMLAGLTLLSAAMRRRSRASVVASRSTA